MTTTIDKDAIRDAYNLVRDDSSEATWALLQYDGNKIVLGCTGSDYDEFQEKFSDDERAYGFVRMIMGDEMSKRAKFAFITWIGPNVSALKRAKASTDKSLVKEVIPSFAVELLTSEREEIQKDHVKGLLLKAGGANYGTGVRD